MTHHLMLSYRKAFELLSRLMIVYSSLFQALKRCMVVTSEDSELSSKIRGDLKEGGRNVRLGSESLQI